MHLRITTVYPQLRIDIQWPRLQINQQVGHFEYEYEGPAIHIDQRQPRNELGMEISTISCGTRPPRGTKRQSGA